MYNWAYYAGMKGGLRFTSKDKILRKVCRVYIDCIFWGGLDTLYIKKIRLGLE